MKYLVIGITLGIIVVIAFTLLKLSELMDKHNRHISDICFERFCIGHDKDKIDLEIMAFADMKSFCPYARRYKCELGECLVCESAMGWKKEFINRYGKEEYDAVSEKSAKTVLSARYPDGLSK